MLGDVLRGSGALRRVGEADLIHVVLIGGNIRRRGGRREHEDAILIRLRADGDAGVGGDGREHHLRAPVEQVVVGVDGFLRVRLVVLRVQLILLAAQRVQLVDGDLRAVGDSRAINRGRAGQRADFANLDRAIRHREGRGHRHRGGNGRSKQLLHVNSPYTGFMKFAGGFLSPPLIGGIIPQSFRQNKRILSVFFTFAMNVFHFTTSILQSVAIHCQISPKNHSF